MKHICFVLLLPTTDELAQMSGLVDQKKLIGGYHKEIGPFFPLCVCERAETSSTSKCVTE